MSDTNFDIYNFINSSPVAKEVFDSCFRQDRKKYYFSKKLTKFEVVENDKQLQHLILYDFPELKKVEHTKSGKEIISIDLPKDFLDLTFFINTIDMINTKVDPFQSEKATFKRFDRTLELITNELLIRKPAMEKEITEDIYKIIIEDYKNHFKDFDKFLNWIIACRFTENRRSSYLHFWVDAGFGKSFISACLKRCGILTECRYEDFKSPSSLSPFELRNAWLILIDEFTVFKKEFKNFTNELITDAKNQLRSIVPLYAKVFMSAEQSPSFEDGVEKQITDRVQQIRPETVPLEQRKKYQEYGNTLYSQCISTYIYLFLKNKAKEYIDLGKIEADKQATKVLNNFLKEYKLKTEDLNNLLFQLFYNKVFDLRDDKDFDSLSRNDQIIKKEHIFLRQDNTFLVHNVKKVFTLMIEQEDENFFKKAKYKTNGLDVVLKVSREDLNRPIRIKNKGIKRGLLINPCDFVYNKKTEKWISVYSQKEVCEVNENGDLVDENGIILF